MCVHKCVCVCACLYIGSKRHLRQKVTPGVWSHSFDHFLLASEIDQRIGLVDTGCVCVCVCVCKRVRQHKATSFYKHTRRQTNKEYLGSTLPATHLFIEPR